MGGHGGLNILPHKSWNPYGQKQRERVEKDEREHRKKVEEKEKKAHLAEAEARHAELLQKAKKRRTELGLPEQKGNVAPPGSSNSIFEKNGHINFFMDFKNGQLSTKNEDAEEERRKEKAEAEKPFTKYLGEGSLEVSKVKPWYLKPENSMVRPHKPSNHAEQELDLLTDGKSLPKRIRAAESDSEGSSVSSGRKRKHKKHKKDKKEKKEKRGKKEKHQDSKKEKPAKKTIEQLRADRLARENIEKSRVKDLLGLGTPVNTDANDGRYNNSFAAMNGVDLGELRKQKDSHKQMKAEIRARPRLV